MGRVYVEQGRNEVGTTIKILEKAKPKLRGKILIKPNITMPFSPENNICTSPKVVEGIIKYLRLRGIDDIVVGEGAGGAKSMSKHFEISGYKDLSERLNISLINLNQDKQIKLKITKGNFLKEVTVAKTFFDRYTINVPKMKTHRMAVVSLAMKNLMGVILPYNKKSVLHPLYENYAKIAIHERRALSQEEFKSVQDDFFNRLIDFYSVCKPNLNIVDGFGGREGDGLTLEWGKNKNMNCVLLSESVPSIDYVASLLMEIDPSKTYLNHIKKFDVSKIKIISNKDINELKEKFKPVLLTEEIKI